MVGKIIAKAGGGSTITLQTQKVGTSGETYVETKTITTATNGDVISGTQTATASSLQYDPGTKQYTEVVNPVGSITPTTQGQTQQSITFPSDYARQGEAQTAAQSISNTLGPKIDKITENGDDPADPLKPPDSEFDDAFFNGTFSSLLGWQLPSHTSQCPTSSFDFDGTTYTINSHCQLVENHFSILSAVMTAVWTVLALFIILGA